MKLSRFLLPDACKVHNLIGIDREINCMDTKMHQLIISIAEYSIVQSHNLAGCDAKREVDDVPFFKYE